MTLRAISSDLGLEERAPESLGSSPDESELPSEAWTELSVESDVVAVEVDGEAGTGVEALVTFTLSFFFS